MARRAFIQGGGGPGVDHYAQESARGKRKKGAMGGLVKGEGERQR